MSTYEDPWQVTPSLLIAHAMKHAKENSDFDKQMAYLIIDIGVKTIFKVFLANNAYKEYKNLQEEAKKNLSEVKFYKLLESVKQTASKKLQGINIDQLNYFHEKRNQIYHQGDGVAPTQENLRRYLELAQKLIKVLIDVDVTDIELQPESKYVVQGKKGLRTVDDISFELQSSLEYFQESCAILTEQLHPKYATRKLAVKLQSIWEAPGGVGLSQDIFDDARSIERLRLFNKLTGMHTEDQGLVDCLIEDANHLYVWIVLQDYSDNFDGDWDKYKNIAARLKRLSDTWKQAIDDSRLDSQKIYQEYKKIRSWISFNQDKIDKRLYGIFPDINRSGPAGMYSFHPF